MRFERSGPPFPWRPRSNLDNCLGFIRARHVCTCRYAVKLVDDAGIKEKAINNDSGTIPQHMPFYSNFCLGGIRGDGNQKLRYSTGSVWGSSATFIFILSVFLVICSGGVFSWCDRSSGLQIFWAVDTLGTNPCVWEIVPPYTVLFAHTCRNCLYPLVLFLFTLKKTRAYKSR